MKTEQAVYDPEFPKLKIPEPKSDPVEKILDMDEKTFRRLFNIPKADLQGSGDQEINKVD